MKVVQHPALRGTAQPSLLCRLYLLCEKEVSPANSILLRNNPPAGREMSRLETGRSCNVNLRDILLPVFHHNMQRLTQTQGSADIAKDKMYLQLYTNLKNMTRAVSHTGDLFTSLQADLDAMRTLAGQHAGQYVFVSQLCTDSHSFY